MEQQEHKHHIKAEFKKIKLRQIIGVTAAIACAVYIHFTQGLDVNRVLIVSGVGLFFSSVNWRCPSCKKYLAHFPLDLQKCTKCGAKFT